MQKIPTLFKRDPARKMKYVLPEVNPDVDMERFSNSWATRKWDGSACLVKGGNFYRRHQHKADKGDPPAGWIHHSGDPEQRSGHGWLPVGESPSDRYHREAWDGPDEKPNDGTYELCGPKVQKNAEGVGAHVLIPHGRDIEQLAPKEFNGLEAYLAKYDGEGFVWWDAAGPVAKLKRKDFPQ